MKNRETLEHYTNQLKESQARLRTLEKEGAKALSRYDIQIAHQGNAEEALTTAKRLLGNQIKYYKRKIVEIEEKPTQLTLLKI